MSARRARNPPQKFPQPVDLARAKTLPPGARVRITAGREKRVYEHEGNKQWRLIEVWDANGYAVLPTGQMFPVHRIFAGMVLSNQRVIAERIR